jgi:retron-type reverse transcriptase
MTRMDKAKPFCIAKRDVWIAYKQVKANRGAAGVDGQSIEEFDRDLSRNLYRIWNRMCSGSYFPPPVRRVDIPKGDSGGIRPLGIPTVSDRIAQMVVKDTWSRSWNQDSTRIPMDIVRVNRRTTH